MDYSMMIENLRYIAKEKGIKIGHIEDELGVSRGYFTRAGTNISAVRLYQASKILNVTVEDLFERDLRREIIKDKIAALEKELSELGTEIL